MKKRYKILLIVSDTVWGVVGDMRAASARERNAKMDASTPFVPYADRAGNVIALAREEVLPFLFQGKPLKDVVQYGGYEHYLSALKNSPPFGTA